MPWHHLVKALGLQMVPQAKSYTPRRHHFVSLPSVHHAC
jgi:hypothetical protein